MAGIAAALALMGGSVSSAGQAGEALASEDTASLGDSFADLLDQPAAGTLEPGAVDITTLEPAPEALGTGIASWYGPRFAGRRTASGERFDPSQFTAAHRTLPFGSMVRVTHLSSGKSVVVRINDRGPFAKGRVIDLSQAAASEIGMVHAGKGEVSLELLGG